MATVAELYNESHNNNAAVTQHRIFKCPPRTVLVAPTNAYRDVLAALSITLRTQAAPHIREHVQQSF